MKTFTKDILRPGTYRVNDRDVKVTPELLKRYASTHAQMVKDGLSIPAPWRHDAQAVPIRLKADKSDVDAYNNGGWWRKVWYDDKQNKLLGEIEVQRDQDIERIEKGSVRHVSPVLKPFWTEGKDADEIPRTYHNAMTHIALVTHPVDPGQGDFVSKETVQVGERSVPESIALSMESLAFADGDDTIGATPNINAASASIGDLLRLLGAMDPPIVLPKDTGPDNLVERMVTAIQAIQGSKKPNDTNPEGAGKDTKEEPPPIAMSFSTEDGDMKPEEVVSKLIKVGLLREDQKDAAVKAFAAKPEVQLSKEQEASIAFARKTAASHYKRRIEDLVSSGRITAEYANKYLAPALKNLEVRFSLEGDQIESPLDVTLKMLESLPHGNCLTGQTPTSAKRSRVKKFGDAFSLAIDATEEELPFKDEHQFASGEFEDDISAEEAEKIVDEQFKNAGIS